MRIRVVPREVACGRSLRTNEPLCTLDGGKRRPWKGIRRGLRGVQGLHELRFRTSPPIRECLTGTHIALLAIRSLCVVHIRCKISRRAPHLLRKKHAEDRSRAEKAIRQHSLHHRRPVFGVSSFTGLLIRWVSGFTFLLLLAYSSLWAIIRRVRHVTIADEAPLRFDTQLSI